MSTKTKAQMEAVLMEKIEKAKHQLEQLQQKHQLEIGSLAYKHGLNQFDSKQLDIIFSRIASEAHS